MPEAMMIHQILGDSALAGANTWSVWLVGRDLRSETVDRHTTTDTNNHLFDKVISALMNLGCDDED